MAFRETLAVALAALALPVGKPVRLWVADEMRYGLQPVTRRVWSLRASGPSARFGPATRGARCMAPWKWRAKAAPSSSTARR